MKWVKIVEEPELAKDKQTWVDQACFRCVSQFDIEEHFGVWEHIKLSPEFKFTPRGKKNYELFVGGFLTFYDEKLRGGTIDHALYMKWEKKDKHAPDSPGVAEVYESVTLFLHPRPRTKVHDHLKMATVEMQNGHAEMSVAPPPGSQDSSIDPPTPPPPPPPPADDLS